MRPFRLLLASLLLFIVILPSVAASPDWVKTYGTETPYPREEFLTGFAAVDKSETDSRNQARDKALAELSGKIRIRVQSELVRIESEIDGYYQSSVSMVTRSSVNTTVEGADFTYYEDRRQSYVLAYIPLQTMVSTYTDDAAAYWTVILKARRDSDSMVNSGETDEALAILFQALTAFPNLYDRWTLVRALDVQGGEKIFFRRLTGTSGLDDLRSMESDIQSSFDDLADRDVRTVDEAIGKIAVMLGIQNVTGGRIQVPPALFESTLFSSEFGRYIADRLEPELIDTLSPGSEPMVFRSQYWVEENHIRLSVLAIDSSGEKTGRAEAILPVSAAGYRDLQPRNFDEAMTALREFAEGAISDGGLNVDVWTNKGRDEDALVFSDGEILQLYFRVNQPAFLQLTYHLATGELVLLEKSFYIGSDRVNMTVQLPYDFEVQAPFGVESMIVTAYSVEPPDVETIPEMIDGELYDVFRSIREVVANTRGLGRRQSADAEMRVGEAMLTMTMLPAAGAAEK